MEVTPNTICVLGLRKWVSQFSQSTCCGHWDSSSVPKSPHVKSQAWPHTCAPPACRGGGEGDGDRRKISRPCELPAELKKKMANPDSKTDSMSREQSRD